MHFRYGSTLRRAWVLPSLCRPSLPLLRACSCASQPAPWYLWNSFFNSHSATALNRAGFLGVPAEQLLQALHAEGSSVVSCAADAILELLDIVKQRPPCLHFAADCVFSSTFCSQPHSEGQQRLSASPRNSPVFIFLALQVP